ncbi:MAG TPA: DUF4129 domain-containing protein [Gemmatimonadaceae bacterium]|nr:DUF4129 domain-containing protein [Gemmatimonadaceae bacterium]
MQIPDEAIRRAAAHVFSAPEYNPFSPLSRVWHWLGHQLLRLLALIGGLFPSHSHSPRLFWVTMAALVVALATAAIELSRRWRRLRIRRAMEERGTAGSGTATHYVDAWRAAQHFAAQGVFTEAAHALYQALLEGVARQGQIRLHPSKTAGDYVRELRGTSSALLDRFRAFAHSYEVVVYGLGTCDRDRFERLWTLAVDIMGPRG